MLVSAFGIHFTAFKAVY